MSDRIIGEHYVENTWTCTSCRVVNRGRDERCTSCGSPRDKSEIDQAPASAAPVTDPKLLEKARAGENRICPFCKAQVRALDAQCSECGARGVVNVYIDPSTGRDSRSGRTPETAVATFEAALGRRSKNHVWAVAVVLTLVICGVYWIHYLFAAHYSTVTVSDRSWRITRALRTRELRHDSGWGSPSGSFNTQCQNRYYGTRSCNSYDCNFHRESYDCRPHDCRCRTYTETKNLKNGFSKVTTRERCDTCYDTCSRTVHDTCWHQCPVYRDWCEYDYYAWPVSRTLTSSGTGSEPPKPPALEAGENQKIEQMGLYSVQWSDGKKLQVGRDDFDKYMPGSAWKVETTRAGGWKIVDKGMTE